MMHFWVQWIFNDHLIAN